MWKRYIFWEYPRGCWQYDVIVGIILAFIFLTPRAWFSDQPRIPSARKIVMLATDHGSAPFWIDKELLGETPDSKSLDKLAQALRAQTGNNRLVVTRIEPIRGPEEELLGYMAFAKP
jgi:hypothetical protein